MNSFCVFLATGLGVGQLADQINRRLAAKKILPFREKFSGAGFWGSLEALLVIYLGLAPEGLWGVACLSLFTLFAVFVGQSAEKTLGRKDDSRIVIDEIAGMYWTVAGFSFAGWNAEKEMWFLLAAFVLFRLFDVLKIPWPVAKSQRLPGGWGIVTDDVLAGVWANLALRAALFAGLL